MNITQKTFKLLDGKNVTFTELQNFVFKAQGRTRNDVQSPRGYYCINIGVWSDNGYIAKCKRTGKYSLTKLGRLYITDRKQVLEKRRIKNLENKIKFYKNRYAETLTDLSEANYKLNRIYTTLTN
jgi:hypothetical protein